MDPFIGEIRLMPFNFAPKDWATCDGQLVAISQNTALFSLLGTRYGGDGKITFALPDMRGRTPLHVSPAHLQGEMDGTEVAVIDNSSMPAHAHGATGSTSGPMSATPSAATLLGNCQPPRGSADQPTYTLPSTSLTALHPATLGGSGMGMAHNNMQPGLVLNFCIAMLGIFPQRQ